MCKFIQRSPVKSEQEAKAICERARQYLSNRMANSLSYWLSQEATLISDLLSLVESPPAEREQVDALVRFVAKGSYLEHPDVRPYRGTNNGDSPEDWKRDYCIAAIRALKSKP